MSTLERTNVKHPFVSVVVPTYKREEPLCQVLTALFEQDYPSFEIIVVDQTAAHTSQTERFLKAHQSCMRYLKLAKPSLPNARNVAVHAARGDIVIFTDDDAIPITHFISAHVGAYDSEGVAGVGGQVIQPDRRTVATTNVGRLDQYTRPIWNFNSTLPTDVMYANGSNMSFRREILFKAGLFETAFAGTAFYEETDLCLRILHTGYRIKFDPRASQHHLKIEEGGCGNNRLSPRWYYWYLHNSFLLTFRHPCMFNFREVLGAHARTIVQDLRDPALLGLLLPAATHAFRSHTESKTSLKRQSGHKEKRERMIQS